LFFVEVVVELVGAKFGRQLRPVDRVAVVAPERDRLYERLENVSTRVGRADVRGRLEHDREIPTIQHLAS
jgi:hypothetical protein